MKIRRIFQVETDRSATVGVGHVICVDSELKIHVEGIGVVTERKYPVILVVEDDNDMRSLLCDELVSEGYQLREAKDGDEALQLVLQSVPDLILTDLKMPAGGFDYISRIKTFAPNCPIVLMTAFGGTQTRAESLKWGASAYFDKPVRIAELKETVKQLLRSKVT